MGLGWGEAVQKAGKNMKVLPQSTKLFLQHEMFYSMRTHTAGSGAMLKVVMKSGKATEKVLKD